MSGEGAPTLAVDGTDVRLGVVASRWHPEVVDALVAAAERRARAAGVAECTVVRVAGALELPVVAQQLAADHDAVVVLGLVLRGRTAHFEHVCRVVADGCAEVALRVGKPVAQGVLMCDDIDQATARAGLPGSAGDKGGEAVEAALAAVATLRELRVRGRRRPGF